MRNGVIQVEGLRDLEDALVALQKEYGGRAGAQALRPAVVAAVKPLEAIVREATPVDSGTLRDSTKSAVGAPTKGMLRSQHYNGSTIIAGRVGWFWGRPSLWSQALAVEYGTRKLPAQHVLDRVFDTEYKGMLRRFKEKLGPAIEKKAAALNRKRSGG